jgi:DNA ligase-associated metallophosphoesterase
VSAHAIEASIAGEDWLFLPEGAALWKARAMLVVADVHIGKAATFRAHGVPVPHGTTGSNLARLSNLIERTRPRTLVFLGDLLHAPEALGRPTQDALAAWSARHADVALVLVEGNHDAKAGALPADSRIERVPEPWRLDSVALRHHPIPDNSATVFAGHMHPVVCLRGRAGASARLPCFWLRAGMVILPAFGDFTGGAPIERAPADRVFAIAEERLFEIPPAVAA